MAPAQIPASGITAPGSCLGYERRISRWGGNAGCGRWKPSVGKGAAQPTTRRMSATTAMTADARGRVIRTSEIVADEPAANGYTESGVARRRRPICCTDASRQRPTSQRSTNSTGDAVRVRRQLGAARSDSVCVRGTAVNRNALTFNLSCSEAHFPTIGRKSATASSTVRFIDGVAALDHGLRSLWQPRQRSAGHTFAATGGSGARSSPSGAAG